ncbi:MAG: hypothetical protein GY790_13350 [Bacteroidetes bacterium]|nr:hypothetical protein [Bacteroidota bacterium]
MRQIYRYFHFLSLDIVFGALATSTLAARLFSANPGWSWWAALALTVWVLYTGDHLLDAWRHRKSPQREMHVFIFKNMRILLWFMGVVGVADILLVFNFLDREMLKAALALGGGVLLFYAMRHIFKKNSFLFIPGEVFVLLLYLAGTWMGPFLTRTLVPESTHIMILILMAGVLLLNLGVISLYDIQLDSRMGIASLALILGRKRTRNLLLGTGIGIYLVSILQFLVFETDRYTQFALVLTGMSTILLLVLLLPSWFRKKDLYRWTVDAVLFMSFLTLLIR